MKKKFIKVTSLIVSFSMLFDIIYPTAALALTGGPSQPEVESFEPVGTTEMVDLFSGDFNYNIPLLTVPGPNGGYPVNLAYHAGIGMEQEASWVGLGWNINVGVINRDMRGIPDDFDGDKVTKEMSMKPNWTVGFDLSQVPNGDKEVLGTKLITGARYQLYYNNYKGVGLRGDLTLTHGKQDASSPTGYEGWYGKLGVSFDSQSGLGFNPSVSYGKRIKKSYFNFNGGISFHSREGVSGLSLKAHRFAKTQIPFLALAEISKEKIQNKLASPGRGTGTRFSGSSYVPHVTSPMKGVSAGLKYYEGKEALFTFSKADFGGLKGEFSIQSLKDKKREINAYGYNNIRDDNNGLGDFNREKEVPVSNRVLSLPVPSATYDVFYVKGQGIGSVYRPYRSDIPVFTDAAAQSSFHKGNLGFDVAPPSPGGKLGVDLGYGYTKSYSGDWQHNNSAINTFNRNVSTNEPLYEPCYYKAAGEQTASPASDYNYMDGSDPVLFNIFPQWDDISFKPKMENYNKETGNTLANTWRKTREKRIQSIQTRKADELEAAELYSTRSKHLFDLNEYPSATEAGSAFNYGAVPGAHIAEITAINPDGNRYIYGIPAYNIKQHDVAFSVKHPTNSGLDSDNESDAGTFIDTYDYPKLVKYESYDASVENEKGTEHFYSKTITPEYAHSYLLTQILSPDYIDLTGNGPSDDDLGYFVKFNYTQANDYKWRIPFAHANYTKGYYSSMGDDKGSYTYGEKKIYYLNSIETKTHIAEFEIEERADARGVNEERSLGTNVANGAKQYRLKQIRLYSKENRNTPVKTVHFEYSYELCRNLPNNINTGTTYSTSGKLTLKKVWFTYQNNAKGALSPYQFDYNEGDPKDNPDYSLMQMDRWGNYRPVMRPSGNTDPFYDALYNHENPYVYQKQNYDWSPSINDDDAALRNKHASAWNLKKITLPSGGEIAVNYEPDDYAYVQNQPAMQMMRIVGTSKTDEETYTAGSESKITGDHLRVYFELDGPSVQSDVSKCVAGLERIYFKTYQRLKKFPAASGLINEPWANDYVDGYAEIVSGGEGIMNDTIGFITLKKVDYYGRGSARQTHPFRKAGWQYLKLERRDLFEPVNDATGAITQLHPVFAAFRVIKEVARTLADFYNVCDIAGYCSKIDHSKPSYLRLMSPDKSEYGGGHRVKSITLSDNWSDMDAAQGDFSYGTEYSYLTEEGYSSGVAEYEPLIGGEEIPLRKPVYYNDGSKKYNLRSEELFIEEPYGESFYPAASVGYSRVVVKNLTHDNVTAAASGINVTEFYTARDFPVKVEYTDPLKARYNAPYIIPFVGVYQFNNNGYSQGYKIELNDMHGKMKSQATYNYLSDLTKDKPVTSVRHIYKTTAPYNPHGENRLDNTVDVLYADARKEQAMLGVTQEMYVDMREDYTYTMEGEGRCNIDNERLAILPTFWPGFERIESMMRWVVTNKIINRTGILQEVVTFNEGALVSSKNILFDAETGVPLLTQTTNEFEDPVYNYKFAGHWAHEGMSGAYKNAGAYCSFEEIGSSNTFQIKINGSATGVNTWDFLFPGDEVEISNAGSTKTYWVYMDMCDRNVITLKDRNGVDFAGSSGTLRVIRSGRRNLQSVTNGTIVSLADPTENREFPMLDAYNTAVASAQAYPFTYQYQSCDPTPLPYLVGVDITDLCTTKTVLAFEQSSLLDPPLADCGETFILFDKVISENDLLGYTLEKYGNKIIGTGPGNAKIYGDWVDLNGCYQECLDNVLHADATEHAPIWYNTPYSDVGDPIGGDPTDNTFRWGYDGVWRAHRSQLIQVDRRQTAPGTDIEKDGTYEKFYLFNWLPSKLYTDELAPYSSTLFGNENYNPKWTWTNEVTKYSPYGFELENRNRLGIYSSAIYGYKNSLPVAITQNSWYFESGYDGFEDYTGVLSTPDYEGHGHIVLKDAGGNMPTNVASGGHTGKYSISLDTTLKHTVPSRNDLLDPGDGSPAFLVLASDRKYISEAWFKTTDATAIPQIRVLAGGSPIASSVIVTGQIEGWVKVAVEFTAPAPVSGNSIDTEIEYRFTTKSSGTYLMDDVRIQPFKSAMTSFVYDSKTLWLIAELDNRNFATFYNYDEEGVLVQVKKETERGVMTVKTSRNNTRQP